MAFGPFENYAPPGVYTRTQTLQETSVPPSGTRIPVLIGTGRETLSQLDFELVRGSSSSVDQRIVNEDVNNRFVLDNSNPNNPILGTKTGEEARFRVRNFPIVSGTGQGLVTNDTRDVTVTVDGELVAPAAVDGLRGVVTLQVAPEETADVRVTYFFNRTDTEFTDDLSNQVDDVEAELISAEIEPFVIEEDANTLTLRVDGETYSLSLMTGERTAEALRVEINGSDDVFGLRVELFTDSQGNDRLRFVADGTIEMVSGGALPALGFQAGQKTTRNRVFYTYQAPIVNGNNGGVVTTDPSDVVVHVDGEQVVPEDVDGTNGAITLRLAPPVGASVVVRYFHNTWQDTFDYLPNTGIRNVRRVGISPGRTDYVEGNDYIIDANGRILWGAAVTVESGQHTAGTEFFDETQISTLLVDNRIYLEEVSRAIDRSVSPPRASANTFVLRNVPTTGNGRSTELDLSLFNKVSNNRINVSTHRADLVKIYHGTSISEALVRGPVTVTGVDPTTRQVTVKDNIPPNHDIWATYYYSRLQDDEVTVQVVTESTASTPGSYRLQSTLLDSGLRGVRFGSKFGTDTSFTVQWPSGVETNPDAVILGTSGVNETVTVEFTEIPAEPATFVNQSTQPYSLYDGTSDTLYLNVDGDDLVVDLSDSGFAVTVSGPQAEGEDFTIVAGENDVFRFEVDNVAYDIDIAPGSQSGEDIADHISRQLPAVLLGTGVENFDLDTDEFDFELNGTAVNVAGLGDDVDADAVQAAINAAIAGAALTMGDPRTPGNDGWAQAVNGSILLEASESLEILAGTGDANVELGFTNGQADTAVVIARYREEMGDSSYFLLRSPSDPAGPSDVSRIRVLDGSANATLNFTNFQTATGAESAVNKPATLLGGQITSANVTALATSGASLNLSVNGESFTVTFAGVTNVNDIASAIDAVITAEGTAVEENGRVRITSNRTTNDSRIEIESGTANQYVGLSAGQTAGQRRVTAAEIAAVLNSHAADWLAPVAGDFPATGYADTFTVSGEGTYLRLRTFSEDGLSNITFAGGAASALQGTNLGISIGDSASGADAMTGFDVSSSNAQGSSGSGIVGKTYTDARTGLRFSVLDNGTYPTADEGFTLVVSDLFTTGTSKVVKAIAGIEMTVANTTDVGEGDTAIVTTYNKTGAEPGIGDFYYITYEYEKTDFSTQLFTRFRDIERNYGAISAENPLTLASYLASLNGAVIIGCKQVLRQPGFGQAAPSAFITALEELSRPLAAGIIPDILVPLTGDVNVMAAYVNHAEIQSSQRFRQERRCIFGTSSGTRPEAAGNIARNLNSERAILVYPDGAIISVANELGTDESFIVDGSYIAAALAGALTSPRFDVAEPLTRRRLVGFRRLNRSLDEPEKNQLAVSGVTVLEDRGPFLQVRDGTTTNVTNRFTSTPSIIAITDFVQQQTRASLDKYVGQKFLVSRAQDVETTLARTLNALREANIIVDFVGVRAEPDPNDPVSLLVSAFFAPVFPLKYIPITFTIGAAGSL